MNHSRSATARQQAPLVSVLLPIRGGRSTTAAAVTSILSQSLGDFELVLIGHENNRSATTELPDDPRIRRIARQSEGIVGALNTGLAAARGSIIARMDDDDIAYPDRLAIQLELMNHLPERALIGARVRMIDSNDDTQGIAGGSERYATWLNGLTDQDSLHQSVFIENPLPHPTWLAPRSVFVELGGYRQGDFPEDHDFVLRAARAGITLAKPKPVLLDWRDHEDRLTRTDPRYKREAFIEMKADALVHPGFGFGLGQACDRGVWIAGVGRSARRWCDALLSRDVAVRGFVDLAGPRMRNSKRHRPVVDYDGLIAQRGEDLLLGAITRPEAREILTTWATSAGLRPMHDYVLAD